jgi:hypothetical protein
MELPRHLPVMVKFVLPPGAETAGAFYSLPPR